MSVKRFPARNGRLIPWAAGVAILAASWGASTASAQQAAPPTNTVPIPTTTADATPPAAVESTAPGGDVTQVGCLGCGAPSAGGCGCGSGGPPGQDSPCNGYCYPGRKPCGCCCNADTCVGKFFCGLYECICCPDPCYQPPHWLAVADSAFFVDATRPITQTRLRVDVGWDLTAPDRAEFFWARESTNPMQQIGTDCNHPNQPGKGPPCIASRVDYEAISLYTEAAADKVSAFIEVPYEEVEPTAAGINNQLPPGPGCCNASGFADIMIGTKMLLLDCELMQLGWEFKTFIPSGNFTKGLGVGHVSLEPSILFSMCLAPDWYTQFQTAYWIPIGGDPVYQGQIWHNHLSLNHVLCKPCCDIQIIGTLELNEWAVFQGDYTSDTELAVTTFPAGTPAPPGAVAAAGGARVLTSPVALSADAVMASAGPGIRLVMCDKVDIGVGSAYAFTGSHWAKELVRTELRLRF